MGLLDDAIREHLELKRRSGAAEDEVNRLAGEALSAPAPSPEPDLAPVAPEPEPVAPEPEPVAIEREPEPVLPAPPPPPPPPPPVRPEPEPWLDEPDEVPVAEALDHPRTAQPTSEFSAEDVAEAHGEPAADYVAPDEEIGDDLLEETPEFLQETPEHDRLWFEQKPPRDFDFGG